MGRCSASEAHLSRLKACTKCSAKLAVSLKQELGSILGGAKRSLGLPNLQGTKPEMYGTPGADNEDAGFHYGTPEDVKIRVSPHHPLLTGAQVRMARIQLSFSAAKPMMTTTGEVVDRSTTKDSRHVEATAPPPLGGLGSLKVQSRTAMSDQTAIIEA